MVPEKENVYYSYCPYPRVQIRTLLLSTSYSTTKPSTSSNISGPLSSIPRDLNSAKHLCWALRRRTLRDTEKFLVSLLSFVLKACDGLVQWDREGNGFLRASATSCKRPLQTPCPSSDGGTVGLVIGPTPEAMV